MWPKKGGILLVKVFFWIVVASDFFFFFFFAGSCKLYGHLGNFMARTEFYLVNIELVCEQSYMNT
jgi:hypothetical protein